MKNYPILKQAEQAIRRLEQAGYEAYTVGGCVRDLIQGIKPSDWDLTTSATPEQILEVFAREKIRLNGIKHGTVTVVLEGCPLEITTYRIDGVYTDSRHPDTVIFTKDLREDLSRRDFTMNAMALHPDHGLIDMFHGQEDIQAGCIRCVGNGRVRFQEDALRILRGIRFMAKTGFQLETDTLAAMQECAALLRGIAGERMQDELIKLVTGRYAGKALRECQDIMGVWIPELVPMFTCDQRNPHHMFNVWEHTVRALEISADTPVIRLTMLFHDIGKPKVRVFDQNGRGHFRGHQEAGAAITEIILKRLRFSRRMSEEILFLIGYHDYSIKMDETAIRKFLGEMGEKRFRNLLQVKKADCCGKGIDYIRVGILLENERTLDRILRQRQCVTLKDLAVDGNDLLELGYEGAEIGIILDRLLERVMEQPDINEKDRLLEILKNEV